MTQTAQITGYTPKSDWALLNAVNPVDYNKLEGGVGSAISAINSIITDMGSMATLNTSIKNSLVGAINELYTSIANISINFNTPGCVNSGTLSGGEANVLSYSGQNVTLASGTVLTLTDRTKVTLASPLVLANTITATGTYHLFYYNGSLLPAANFYVQKTQPSPTGTAIWRNTSIEPFVDKYFDGSSWIGANYNCAHCGAYTVATSTVASVIQPTFNINYYDKKEMPVYDHGTLSGSFTSKLDRLNKVVPSGDTTIVLPTNVPKGIEIQVEVELTNGATVYTIYQPTVTWDWVGSPVLDAVNKKYRIFYTTTDGGVTWGGSWKKCGA